MYKLDSKGKVRVWEANVSGDKTFYIEISSGLLDGKLSIARKDVTPKNVGKKNETTQYEQALKEVESLRKKKYKEGYRDTVDELADVPGLPMKAHKFEEKKKYISYPALIQPKLNGVRCIAERKGENIIYTSKLGNEFKTLSHLDEYLLDLLNDGAKIDGEIYVHDWSLQRISSAIKAVNEDTENLLYFVYDLPMDGVECETRQAILQRALGEPKWLMSKLRHTYTDIVHSEAEVMLYTKAFIDENFEGAMVRNLNSKYKFSYRSNDLLKVKFMEDEEFEIIGYEKEIVYIDSTAYKAVIWKCRTADGGEFNCRPKGTREQRIEWYKNADRQIGKMLTVQFQELSEDMIPIFPVGILVRDYE